MFVTTKKDLHEKSNGGHEHKLIVLTHSLSTKVQATLTVVVHLHLGQGSSGGFHIHFVVMGCYVFGKEYGEGVANGAW